jgi:hypothetical protein
MFFVSGLPGNFLLEAGADYQLHQLRVIGQVDGRLGVKIEGILLALHPGDDGRQHLPLQFWLVADEVVLDEENGSPPTLGIKVLQFGDALSQGLAAGLAAEQGGIMSQNSQSKGQPRPYWIFMAA